MKTIPLTRGQFALVDDADYALVSSFKWFAICPCKCWYAVRTVRVSGKNTTVYLHRFLNPGAELVDHRNGIGLDCQRHNLRVATNRKNSFAVRKKAESAASRFRGVSRHRAKWQAQIQKDGKKVHLGVFDSDIDAAHAYDDAARSLFLEWAAPNFS